MRRKRVQTQREKPHKYMLSGFPGYIRGNPHANKSARQAVDCCSVQAMADVGVYLGDGQGEEIDGACGNEVVTFSLLGCSI